MIYICNELLFVCQSVLVALFAVGALFFGRGGVVSFVILGGILSNIFVRKQTTLFGLDVVTCDALAIGSDLAIHLLYEYYGKKEAENSIWLYLYISLFFIVITQCFLWYIPNMHDTTQAEYLAVFGPMPWIIASSCVIALATKALNLSLYHLFSTWWADRFFTKTILALLISQLFDTVAFTVVALSGSVYSLTQIIIFSYSIKCLAIITGIPLVTVCRKYLPFTPCKQA